MSKIKTLSSRLKPLKPKRNIRKVVERPHGRPAARDRDRVLKRDDYLCVKCRAEGRTTLADEVDHIVPLHLGGGDNDSNKQSLCKACHAAKTAQEAKERGLC